VGLVCAGWPPQPPSAPSCCPRLPTRRPRTTASPRHRRSPALRAPSTGSNVGATKQSGEPNHAGNAGGASVWYAWTAPATGSVTITTAGSSFDTLLGVYTGSAVDALTQVAANDDVSTSTFTSSVTFNATSGTTYRIAVDGYRNTAAATGTVKLNWSSCATKESGEPNHAGNAGGASIWWTAPASGTVTFTTAGSGFDTVLGVYTGSAVNALTAVASNDDATSSERTSRVTFTATAGTTYQIAVDGYRHTSTGVVETGSVTLAWS
jgi:hypothetical protein